MEIQNYYTILGLSEDSSCEEIYEECRDLFIKYHPSITNSEETFRKFVSVNDAYGILLDEEVRSDYNYLLSKYSKESPVDIEDKNIVDRIMNLIIEKRKGMKKMFTDNNSTQFSILFEAPITLSSDYSSIDISNLIEGLSFPDLDFNLFDFLDMN